MNINFSQFKLRKNLQHILALSLCFSAHQSFAVSTDGLVEIEPDLIQSESYLSRRGQWGHEISLVSQAFLPSESVSAIDSSAYEAVYAKDPVGLIGFDYKTKYNMSKVSLLYGPHFMTGKLKGESESQLEVSQYGLGLELAVDGLYDSPYIVPYVGVQVWKMGIKETKGSQSFSGTTEVGNSLRFGAKINLNNIDDSTALRAYKNFGIEHTYLNIGVVSYQKTSGTDDFNTTSASQLNLGLGFEL